MNSIYLDNAATTRISETALAVMEQVYRVDYGNPSSLHRLGVDAEQYIKTAAEQAAKTLKVQPKEIVFTSGGTESNNLALFGAARANQRNGNRILTTAIEHPSVHSAAEALMEQGFDVRFLPVDSAGRLSLDALKEALTADTILVSVMLVNNEIGTVEPVAEAAALVHSLAPKALFHVDAIQAYGKMRIEPKKLGIDLLSVSGHKIHGPKGSGFLYFRDKTKLEPVLFGGGQQKGLRSGTENVPAIAGLGAACEEAYRELEGGIAAMRERRAALIAGLLSIEGVTINGPEEPEDASPHIISVSVRDVRAEVLLHALEEAGVYVSAGSACSSHKKTVSPTLSAIGLEKDLLESTVRFSLSRETTEEEIAAATDAMRDLVPRLRKFIRR